MDLGHVCGFEIDVQRRGAVPTDRAGHGQIALLRADVRALDVEAAARRDQTYLPLGRGARSLLFRRLDCRIERRVYLAGRGFVVETRKCQLCGSIGAASHFDVLRRCERSCLIEVDRLEPDLYVR